MLYSQKQFQIPLSYQNSVSFLNNHSMFMLNLLELLINTSIISRNCTIIFNWIGLLLIWLKLVLIVCETVLFGILDKLFKLWMYLRRIAYAKSQTTCDAKSRTINNQNKWQHHVTFVLGRTHYLVCWSFGEKNDWNGKMHAKKQHISALGSHYINHARNQSNHCLHWQNAHWYL